MTHFKKITSKRVGGVLAVVFVVLFVATVIYSRSYRERRKPLVHVGFPQTTTASWSYETNSTIEPADEVYAEARGTKWTVEAFVPFSAYSDYGSDIRSLEAYALSENVARPERLIELRRWVHDNGDIEYIFEYTSVRENWEQNVWPGEEVTVQLFSQFSDTQYTFLLPFSALHEDALGGLYIFSVIRREGAWGYEYVAVRNEVTLNTLERIGDMANVYDRPTEDPIVISSDKPLYDGALVRIYD